MKSPVLFLLIALVLSVAPAPSMAARRGQIVFQGGVIHTGDPAAPVMSALAVRDGRILYLGNDVGVQPFIDRKTRVIRLGENALFPGFVDQYFRLEQTAAETEMVDLSGATSAREIIRMLGQAARVAAPNGWVLGRGWDSRTGIEHPLILNDISNACGRHPVCLFHATDDALFASVLTMTLAGIDSEYPDPPGGRLDRGASGGPTGILLDRAADVVRGTLPRKNQDRLAVLLRAAADSAASRGITSVSDPSITAETLAVLEEIASSKRMLPVRFEGALSGTWTELVPLMKKGPRELAGGLIRIAAISILLDGGLNTGGAALNAAYQNEPANIGTLQYTTDEVTAQIEAAAATGHSVWISATGDRAVSTAVRGLEQAMGDEVVRSTRPRLIGADLADDDDVERLRGTGATVTILPSRRDRSMGWLTGRIGERSDRAYNWRAFAAADIPLRLASGSPSANPSPLRDFRIAVTSPRGLTREEALNALTGGAVLRTGGPADFTVVSADIMSVPDEALPMTRALCTVVDGNIVFECLESP